KRIDSVKCSAWLATNDGDVRFSNHNSQIFWAKVFTGQRGNYFLGGARSDVKMVRSCSLRRRMSDGEIRASCLLKKRPQLLGAELFARNRVRCDNNVPPIQIR